MTVEEDLEDWDEESLEWLELEEDFPLSEEEPDDDEDDEEDEEDGPARLLMCSESCPRQNFAIYFF